MTDENSSKPPITGKFSRTVIASTSDNSSPVSDTQINPLRQSNNATPEQIIDEEEIIVADDKNNNNNENEKQPISPAPSSQTTPRNLSKDNNNDDDTVQNPSLQQSASKNKKVGFHDLSLTHSHSNNDSTTHNNTGYFTGAKTNMPETFMGNTQDVAPTLANYQDTADREKNMSVEMKQQKNVRPTMEQLMKAFKEGEEDADTTDQDENNNNIDFHNDTAKLVLNQDTDTHIDGNSGNKKGKKELLFSNENLGESHQTTDFQLHDTDNDLEKNDLDHVDDAYANLPKNKEEDIETGDSKEIPLAVNSSKDQDISPKSQPKAAAVKFGWIEGVFVRCLLNIWGVMLFLRMSWIVGQAGILNTIFIILLATVVTTITTSSMSAVCTNGTVKGGGAYFLISRSLGPEFGGAIGLIFSVANAVAVAMYIAGFTETITEMYTAPVFGANGFGWDTRVWGVITCFVLLCITQAGQAWESKMQIVLLIILILSIINWLVGSCYSLEEDLVSDQAQGFFGYKSELIMDNMLAKYTEKENFFSIFSIFFPAATGILAGSNISGDLKDAATAIPKGTFLAIGVTSAVYIGIAFTLGGTGVRYGGENPNIFNDTALMNNTYQSYQRPCTDYNADLSVACKFQVQYPEKCLSYYNEDPSANTPTCLGLLNDMQFMGKFSAWRPIITAGIFAATLSSALTCLVSAPKIFQALCKDNIFPEKIFGRFAKGYGPNDDPRAGYILCFGVSVMFIMVGDLNTIAPLISNFFLASYCLINWSCFMASLSKAPGWRPAFKYYNMWVSLFGALACGGMMFLIDAVAGFVTLVIMVALYLYIAHRQKSAVESGAEQINWGSSSQGYAYKHALANTQKLENIKFHVKNFRPGTLVLSGNPMDRPALVYLANCFTKETSLLICGNVIFWGYSILFSLKF